jgi:hypothetical protein
MHEVGWPDPAAVVDIIERMRKRRAFSLISATVDEEGPAGEVALMKYSFVATVAGHTFSSDIVLPFSGAVRERVRTKK